MVARSPKQLGSSLYPTGERALTAELHRLTNYSFGGGAVKEIKSENVKASCSLDKAYTADLVLGDVFPTGK